MTDEIYGTVIRWNERYGFLRPDGTGPDLFFHISDIAGKPERGDRVSFQTAPDQKNPAKLRAVQVKIEGVE